MYHPPLPCSSNYSHISPLESLSNAEILFHNLGPHLQLHQLRSLSQKFTKFVKSSSSSSLDQQQLKASLRNFTFISLKKRDGWLTALLVRFCSSSTHQYSSSNDDRTFAPHLNQKTFHRDVKILSAKKETARGSDLTWSTRYNTKRSHAPPGRPRLLQSEKLGLNNSLEDDVATTEDLANILAYRLPPTYHKKRYDLFSSYNESSSSTTTTTKMKCLHPKLKHWVRYHFQLVPTDVASFLKVSIPPKAKDNGTMGSWDVWDELRGECAVIWRTSQNEFVRGLIEQREEEIQNILS